MSAHDPSNAIGSIPWMAPEVTTAERLSEKVDVYSMGIIIFEVLKRSMPYQQIPMHGIPHLVGKVNSHYMFHPKVQAIKQQHP